MLSVFKRETVITEIISQTNGLLLKKSEETKIEPKKFETFGSQRFNLNVIISFLWSPWFEKVHTLFKFYLWEKWTKNILNHWSSSSTMENSTILESKILGPFFGFKKYPLKPCLQFFLCSQKRMGLGEFHTVSTIFWWVAADLLKLEELSNSSWYQVTLVLVQ